MRLLERDTRTVTLTKLDAGFMNRSFRSLWDWKKQQPVAASKDAVQNPAVNMDPFVATDPRTPTESLPKSVSGTQGRTPNDRLGDLVAEGFDLAIRFGEPVHQALVARKLLVRESSR